MRRAIESSVTESTGEMADTRDHRCCCCCCSRWCGGRRNSNVGCCWQMTGLDRSSQCSTIHWAANIQRRKHDHKMGV